MCESEPDGRELRHDIEQLFAALLEQRIRQFVAFGVGGPAGDLNLQESRGRTDGCVEVDDLSAVFRNRILCSDGR